MKKLVLFGLGDLAEIALEYFNGNSEYDVVGFTVDRDFLPPGPYFHGLPVVPFDKLEEFFPPYEHYIHVALVYNNMNRDRAQTIERAKAKNYRLASYVSQHAFVANNVTLGEHVFIFEDNVIQSSVVIGDNCILWSGNHVGHHSRIGNNVFVSSHVVISGRCSIGDNCFLGVNATLANATTIGKDSWVMHGALLSGEIPSHSMVSTVKSAVQPLNEVALARALARAKQKGADNG